MCLEISFLVSKTKILGKSFKSFIQGMANRNGSKSLVTLQGLYWPQAAMEEIIWLQNESPENDSTSCRPLPFQDEKHLLWGVFDLFTS